MSPGFWRFGLKEEGGGVGGVRSIKSWSEAHLPVFSRDFCLSKGASRSREASVDGDRPKISSESSSRWSASASSWMSSLALLGWEHEVRDEAGDSSSNRSSEEEEELAPGEVGGVLP